MQNDFSLPSNLTIYNADAFKTMRGDPLKHLLAKMPGLEVKDNALYANGEKVSMVLVNGSALFGKNVLSAMDLLRSEEIEKVRVFDEYDRTRYDDIDSLREKKKRVVDVKTKKAINRVAQSGVSASVGTYLDKDADGNSVFRGHVGGNYSQFAPNKPRIISTISLSQNENMSLNKHGSGYFLLDGSKKSKKINYSATLLSIYSDYEGYSRSENRYYPTAEYVNRLSEQLHDYRDKEFKLDIHGSVTKTSKNKVHTLYVSPGIEYRMNRNEGYNMVANTTDALSNRSDLHYDKNSAGYKVAVSTSYKTKFKEGGKRNLEVYLRYHHNDGGGDGWSVDTLPTSTTRQWLTNESSEVGDMLDTSIRFSGRMGKNWGYNVLYSPTLNISRAERLSWDELMMQIDNINTYLYQNDYFTQNIAASVNYSNKDHSLMTLGSIGYIHKRLLRSEQKPDDYTLSHTFDAFLPHFQFFYNKQAVRVQLTYNSSMKTPDIQQLRNVIDNSSPLYLTAGNPLLKRSLNHSASMQTNYTHAKSALALSFHVGYNACGNAVVDRVVYYASDTYLPEYDYMVNAGTTLSTPINAGTTHNLNSRLSVSKNMSKLQSTVTANLGYNFAQMPSFVGGQSFVGRTHTAIFELMFNSGFSRVVEFSVGAKTSPNWNFRDSEQLYRGVAYDVDMSLRVNFLKRLWVRCNAYYHYYNTNQPGMRNEYFTLNADLACKFGKNDAGEISINGGDLLNTVSNFEVKNNYDYVSSVWNQVFGRSIYLKFSYNIMGR